MKLRLRIFAVLLVLAMVFAVAVGCTDNSRLDELQAQIDALKDQVDSLQSELDAKQTTINTLTADLLGLTADFAELEGKYAANMADIANLQKLSNTVIETYDEAKFVVLHTNDTHGRHTTTSAAFGMASLLALRNIYESRGYTVILVDNGDSIQGTPLVNVDEGANAIDFMNLVGYDLAVPGNHEFDWGFENLLDLAKGADFEYIAANLVYSDDNSHGKTPGDTVFAANKIYTIDGTKIGFFGLATPETATKAHPDKVQGVEFLAGNDLYECAQEQVDKLRQAGCEIVIAVGHLGTDSSSAPNRSTDVIAEVSGIDVFIDGHSHSVWENEEVEDADGNTTILASTGEYMKNLGVLTFNKEDAPTSYLLRLADAGEGLRILTEFFFADKLNYINEVNESVDELLSVVFAETAILLHGTQPEIRMQETNLGNFATDALLWQARQVAGDENVDAALTNGGGIRDSIKAGNVTMKDMVTVFPFGNTVVVIEVTGSQLWEALEAATFSIDKTSNGRIGAFPQVAGIEYTIDTAVDWNPTEKALKETNKDNTGWKNPYLYASSTYSKPDHTWDSDDARVTIATVNGVAFDATATYKIATNDFTAAGGDTYGVFRSCLSFTNMGVALENALINYVNDSGIFGKNAANLPLITADKIIGGRITII